MSSLKQVVAGAGADTLVNELLRALSPAGLFGLKSVGGLTLSLYGGFFNDVDVPDQNVTLAASSTNYLVAHRTTGAVTSATNTTNWNNQTTYMRLYQFATGPSTITIAANSDRRQAYVRQGGTGVVVSLVPGTGIAVDDTDPANPVVSATAPGGSTDPTLRVGSLTKWTTAKARGAANPARLAFVGDSNVAGQGTATGTNGLTGAAATCMARKFATLAGFQIESFFGEQNVLGASGTVAGYDPRIALGSGWAGDTAPNVFGGRFMKSTAAPAGRLTFSPVAAFSKFRIWHPISSVGNTATTIYVDGSLVDTFSEAGSNAFTSKDYTVSAGTHVIGVGGGATGNVFVAGIETFDGTSKPVMLQGGWSGAKAADINGSTDPWSYRNSLVAMAPDFTIVYCTINDGNAKTAGNTYYAAMEALVKALSPSSGGCLCVGLPANMAATNDSYYDAMATLLKNLATDYGWFFYDGRRIFGRSFARATDKGYIYDAMHPNVTGSDAFAGDLYTFLSSEGL